MDRSKYRSTKPLLFFGQHFYYEFREIIDYLNETKDLFESEAQKIIRYVEKASEGRSKEEINEMSEHYVDEIEKYNLSFKSLLLSSTFISAFTLFENSLKTVGRLSIKDFNMRLKLHQCKDKIQREFNVELDFPEWRELNTTYKLLRNAITHNNSNIKGFDKSKSEDDRELYEYITSNSNPDIEFNSTLNTFNIFDKHFVIEFCNKAERYLKQVVKAIPEDQV